MDNIVIIGGGGHAKVLINIIKKNNDFAITGYTDNNDCGEQLGIKYLGNDTILGELITNNKCSHAALGVGQINLNNKRYIITGSIKNLGYKFPAIISKDSIINEDVSIGEGTVVFDGVVINSGSKIGKFSILNTGVIIDHDCEIGDHTHIATGAVLSGGVKVRSNSMIGAGATVIQYKEIAESCMIGAGAVVTNDLKEPGVYAGIPAKKIK